MFSDYEFSKRWLKLGLERLEDQVSQLLVMENNHAIFKENSIGYHGGVIRLLKISSEITSLFNKESIIHEVYEGMNRFMKLMTYPDGRCPAQGDTMRIPNEENITRFSSTVKKEVIGLQKSGYAVVKGLHYDDSFMLTFYATSLSKTHKHEDNLSFTLFFDMIEWLIDPSYYSHEYQEKNYCIPSFIDSSQYNNY